MNITDRTWMRQVAALKEIVAAVNAERENHYVDPETGSCLHRWRDRKRVAKAPHCPVGELLTRLELILEATPTRRLRSR